MTAREARQDDAASSKNIEKAIDRVYASKAPIRTVDDLKKVCLLRVYPDVLYYI